MFKTLANAWKIIDLRQKILYTLFVILIFRIGSAIPAPFLDANVIRDTINQMSASGSIFGYFDMLTGGAFGNATVLALAVTPYINASIIMQLLTIAIPALERLQKDGGEEGRKKIKRITRYVTVGFSFLSAFGYYVMMLNMGGVGAVKYTTGFEGVFAAIVIVLTLVAGAMFTMWLGEQCSSKGIGNGISILIFTGILSSMPSMGRDMFAKLSLAMTDTTGANAKYFAIVPIAIIVLLAILVFIVFMTNAERRIPIQYAKRVVGRKMYGGQNTNIPIKVNMSGVLPVIFASSFLSLPATIKMFLPASVQNGGVGQFLDFFGMNQPFGMVLYFLLIIAFNYFYISVQYNPVEIANNLRKNNGGIPGIRPGKSTSDFISRVVGRVTFIGALFLGIVAISPTIYGALTGINLSFGGTSMIILVGVALETTKSIESQMMMRHYKGFLE